jgi:hypothetical protein
VRRRAWAFCSWTVLAGFLGPGAVADEGQGEGVFGFCPGEACRCLHQEAAGLLRDGYGGAFGDVVGDALDVLPVRQRVVEDEQVLFEFRGDHELGAQQDEVGAAGLAELKGVTDCADDCGVFQVRVEVAEDCGAVRAAGVGEEGWDGRGGVGGAVLDCSGPASRDGPHGDGPWLGDGGCGLLDGAQGPLLLVGDKPEEGVPCPEQGGQAVSDVHGFTSGSGPRPGGAQLRLSAGGAFLCLRVPEGLFDGVPGSFDLVPQDILDVPGDGGHGPVLVPCFAVGPCVCCY